MMEKTQLQLDMLVPEQVAPVTRKALSQETAPAISALAQGGVSPHYTLAQLTCIPFAGDDAE